MARLKISFSIEGFILAWKFQSQTKILNIFNLWVLWVPRPPTLAYVLLTCVLEMPDSDEFRAEIRIFFTENQPRVISQGFYSKGFRTYIYIYMYICIYVYIYIYIYIYIFFFFLDRGYGGGRRLGRSLGGSVLIANGGRVSFPRRRRGGGLSEGGEGRGGCLRGGGFNILLAAEIDTKHNCGQVFIFREVIFTNLDRKILS